MTHNDITGNEVYIHRALVKKQILKGFTNADEILGRKTKTNDFVTKAELFEDTNQDSPSDEEIVKAFSPDEIGLDNSLNCFYPDGTKHKFEKVDYIKKGGKWYDFEKSNMHMSGAVISHPDQPGVKYQKQGNEWKHMENSEKLKEGLMHVGSHESHPVHGLAKGTKVRYKFNGADDEGIIGSHKKEPSGVEYANIHHIEGEGGIGKKKIGLEYTKIYKNDEKGNPTSEFHATAKRRASSGEPKPKFENPHEAAVHALAGHVKSAREAMASYPEDSKEYAGHHEKMKNLVNTMHTTNVYAGNKSPEESTAHIHEKTGIPHNTIKKLVGMDEAKAPKAGKSKKVETSGE